jgi:membrane protein YdbS with pleckstrin-like domain
MVHIWAIQGDWDPSRLASGSLEWPPRSGRMQSFPEIDRADVSSRLKYCSGRSRLEPNHRCRGADYRKGSKMGYIEHSLGANEVLIYKARFHWLYYAAAWATLILLIVLVSLILFYASAWTEIILLGGCVIGLLVLLRRMLPIWTTEIGVSNHRLIMKRGWLSRSTDELQLKAIEQVNFKQGFVGRLFGFGQVDVHGTGVDDLHIPAIADPHGLLKAIEEATSPSKQTTGSA